MSGNDDEGVLPDEMLAYLHREFGYAKMLEIQNAWNSTLAQRSGVLAATRGKMFDATIRFAEITIRSLLLLNGGAAVALLAFAGNAKQSGLPDEQLSAYASAVQMFGWGALLSVGVAALAYLAQLFFTEMSARKPHPAGIVLRCAAIFMAFVSLGLFGCGTYKASQAIKPHETVQQQTIVPSDPKAGLSPGSHQRL